MRCAYNHDLKAGLRHYTGWFYIATSLFSGPAGNDGLQAVHVSTGQDMGPVRHWQGRLPDQIRVHSGHAPDLQGFAGRQNPSTVADWTLRRKSTQASLGHSKSRVSCTQGEKNMILSTTSQIFPAFKGYLIIFDNMLHIKKQAKINQVGKRKQAMREIWLYWWINLLLLLLRILIAIPRPKASCWQGEVDSGSERQEIKNNYLLITLKRNL